MLAAPLVVVLAFGAPGEAVLKDAFAETVSRKDDGVGREGSDEGEARYKAAGISGGASSGSRAEAWWGAWRRGSWGRSHSNVQAMAIS